MNRNLSLTNSIQEVEERTSGIEDKIEEIDTLVKDNIASEKTNPGTKHTENLGQ